MTTRLRNLRITRVASVGKGANPGAEILIWKSATERQGETAVAADVEFIAKAAMVDPERCGAVWHRGEVWETITALAKQHQRAGETIEKARSRFIYDTEQGRALRKAYDAAGAAPVAKIADQAVMPSGTAAITEEARKLMAAEPGKWPTIEKARIEIRKRIPDMAAREAGQRSSDSPEEHDKLAEIAGKIRKPGEPMHEAAARARSHPDFVAFQREQAKKSADYSFTRSPTHGSDTTRTVPGFTGAARALPALDDKAKELMAANPGWSLQRARVEARKRNPDLAQQEDDERKSRAASLGH